MNDPIDTVAGAAMVSAARAAVAAGHAPGLVLGHVLGILAAMHEQTGDPLGIVTVVVRVLDHLAQTAPVQPKGDTTQ